MTPRADVSKFIVFRHEVHSEINSKSMYSSKSVQEPTLRRKLISLSSSAANAESKCPVYPPLFALCLEGKRNCAWSMGLTHDEALCMTRQTLTLFIGSPWSHLAVLEHNGTDTVTAQWPSKGPSCQPWPLM